MEKIEPKMKMEVWNSVLQYEVIRFTSKKKFSFKEEECADIYVNCWHLASWEDLARTLYQHHQMDAVKEVRSYLPPRGEPHFGVLQCFNLHVYMYALILLL